LLLHWEGPSGPENNAFNPSYRFALRVIIQVGLNDGNLTTIKDIAQVSGSRRRPVKVVSDLSQKGYITVRGRNGGIRRARTAGHQYRRSGAHTGISSVSLAALHARNCRSARLRPPSRSA
jgi:hypothetical protein